MLSAPSRDPIVTPANMTTSVCNVMGTGVPGNGTAIAAPAAVSRAKPTTPTTRTRRRARAPAATDPPFTSLMLIVFIVAG